MTPTVSCICVTQNRRFFLRQAIAYFWRAHMYFEALTGLSSELVIVDGSAHDNSHLLDTARGVMGERIAGWLKPVVQYHHAPSPEHSRTGWFHNEAVRLAKGEIIIQWDDDDWHDGSRIFKQWAALRDVGEPAFAWTSRFYWYHVLEKKACQSRAWHSGGGSLGAMFAYHRSVWQNVPFQDVPQGEDNYFFDDCVAQKVPMVDMKDPSFCIYMRHNQNGSPLLNGMNYDESHTANARQLLAISDDLEFYDELTELLPLAGWNRPLQTPMNHYQAMQALGLSQRFRGMKR